MTRRRTSQLAVPILALLITLTGGGAFALPPGGPGGGGGGAWNGKCVACHNDCIDRYGTDQGSLKQCYALCVAGGSCPASGGGGGVGRLPKKPKPKAPN
jgi:hypothetical protein